MRKPRHLIATGALLACAAVQAATPTVETPLKPGDALPAATTEPPAVAEVRDIEWLDLIPEQERKNASLVPPAPLHDYLGGEGGPGASQPMTFSVNEALDGRLVRIPGFIVPLEIDARGEIIELFLVPFFGACIHVPPPPPNQIVRVTLEQGLKAEAMYAAFWITGPLRVQRTTTRLGVSTYSIAAQRVEEYKF